VLNWIRSDRPRQVKNFPDHFSGIPHHEQPPLESSQTDIPLSFGKFSTIVALERQVSLFPPIILHCTCTAFLCRPVSKARDWQRRLGHHQQHQCHCCLPAQRLLLCPSKPTCDWTTCRPLIVPTPTYSSRRQSTSWKRKRLVGQLESPASCAVRPSPAGETGPGRRSIPVTWQRAFLSTCTKVYRTLNHRRRNISTSRLVFYLENPFLVSCIQHQGLIPIGSVKQSKHQQSSFDSTDDRTPSGLSPTYNRISATLLTKRELLIDFSRSSSKMFSKLALSALAAATAVSGE
jgi:hypothetical protein